jgi:hypothetical protein
MISYECWHYDMTIMNALWQEKNIMVCTQELAFGNVIGNVLVCTLELEFGNIIGRWFWYALSNWNLFIWKCVHTFELCVEVFYG